MAIPNLTGYRTKKANKLISIQKIDDLNVAIKTKQFSSQDGTKLPDRVVGVAVSEVDEAITKKKEELVELEAFKEDLSALE